MPPQNENWISKKVQTWVSAAGSLTNTAITSVGTNLSSAGQATGNSVTNTSRGWADGVRGYGNAIKDSTGAAGPRAVTASNPLGIAGAKGVWAPSATAGKGRNSGGGTAKNPLGLGK